MLIALYAALPAASQGRNGAALVKLVIGLVLFAALLGWQIRTILAAEHPELQAVEALAISALLLIVVFAYTYLSLSRAHPHDFSQPLDHVGAVYFTVTTISTVGFGDITAKSDLARLVVVGQILLDFVLVVGLVRTLVFAARVAVRRQRAQ